MQWHQNEKTYEKLAYLCDGTFKKSATCAVTGACEAFARGGGGWVQLEGMGGM